MLYVIQSLCSGAAKARGSGVEPGTVKVLCTMEAGTALSVHMGHSKSAGRGKGFLSWSKLQRQYRYTANENVG